MMRIVHVGHQGRFGNEAADQECSARQMTDAEVRSAEQRISGAMRQPILGRHTANVPPGDVPFRCSLS